MKKRVKIPLIIIGVIIGLLAVAAIGVYIWWNSMLTKAGYKEDWSDADGTVITDIAYGKKPSNTFDLYIPATASKDRPQALMLYIHGGAWTGGDKSEEAFDCRRFAKEGYFTATMDYTVINPNNHQASVMSMLDEIQACVTRIKEYTDSLGYHIDRMSTSGISAGGHLSMLYALKCADQSPIPIVFIAQRVGPANLAKMFGISKEDIDEVAADIKAGRPNEKKTEIDKTIFVVTGKTMTPQMYTKEIIDSLLLSSSPVTYIGPNSVPAAMAYGEKDGTVHPMHPQEIDSLYKAYNIPHVLMMFPNSGHLLADDPDYSQRYIAEVKKYCKKYFGY